MDGNVLAITQVLSDDAILAELGQRLSRYRIDAGLTQQALAVKAGVSKSTLERIEAGAPSQLPNLIRVLRALDLLSMLDAAIPPPVPRPMELLRHRYKRPQRVRSKQPASNAGTQADNKPTATAWVWGDER